MVAALLQYLFLSSFFWMLIAGFQIYVLLVEVFEPDGSRFVQVFTIILMLRVLFNNIY